jgi:hypothetical protein
MEYDLTGDQVGPLGGKWRPLVGKVREWYVENGTLKFVAPACVD